MSEAPAWFVVFEHAESVWWHRLCRPGFGHCYAFGVRRLPDLPTECTWLIFDPGFSSLTVTPMPEAMASAIFAQGQLRQVRILRVPAEGTRLVRPRWLVTCAGAVAALVGMRATPWTPWGLYRRLLRDGAERIA